jgi:hypothetical protein
MDRIEPYIKAIKFLLENESSWIFVSLDKRLLNFKELPEEDLILANIKVYAQESGLHPKKLNTALRQGNLPEFYSSAKNVTIRTILEDVRIAQNPSLTALNYGIHPKLVWHLLRLAYAVWQWNKKFDSYLYSY